MLDITTLRVFLAAAEEGGFTRAAERLHLSQSAVSQHIQNLERTYGIRLFVREGRSVKLSEHGQIILPLVREILGTANLLEEVLLQANAAIGGDLTIGCSTSAGKYILPVLLAGFKERYPAVFPRVRVMPRELIVEHLLNRVLHFGVFSRKIEHPSIECTPLFEDRIVLIVPITHPWANFGRALPSDLLDQPLILREENSGTREALNEALRAQGIAPEMLHVTMELGNPEAIEMSVEQGLGIAFVSEMVAARHLALGRIRIVEVEGLNLRKTIYLARRRDTHRTRAQSLFWDYVQAQHHLIREKIWPQLTGGTTPQDRADGTSLPVPLTVERQSEDG